MIFLNPTKRHVWQAEIVLPLGTVLLLFVGGIFKIDFDSRTATGSSDRPATLRVTLIQPSIPQTLIWSPREDEKRFAELLAQSQQALTNGADLLVWPESAVPMFDGVYDLISQFAQTNHAAVIFNGDDAQVRAGATDYFNAAFFIGTDGRCNGVYHKQNLVIFGEYVPLARWLPFLKYLTPIQGGWTPGDRPVIFAGNNFTAAPLICFEDCFPKTARAAAAGEPDFLVNLSNDGWFGESAEQRQHLANAVFRAVENGLPLVRCSNNGVTGWIDAHGRLREILGDKNGNEYAAGALTVEVPLRPASGEISPTFFRRHGDCFAWGCAAITIFTIASNRRKRRATE